MRGHHSLLFTTDIASRGLDLLNVSLVINFDMPKVAAEFVLPGIAYWPCRCNKGTAVSLVSLKDWPSYLAVQQLLQLDDSFTALPGLEAKFNGQVPAPRKPRRAQHRLPHVKRARLARHVRCVIRARDG